MLEHELEKSTMELKSKQQKHWNNNNKNKCNGKKKHYVEMCVEKSMQNSDRGNKNKKKKWK